MKTQRPAASVILDKVAAGALALACAALVAMALIEAWQVFARYVLNDSPSWTEPLALMCMSTTMMLGAAAGVRASRHFGFFILVESAAPRSRLILLGVARIIALAIGAMLAIWGGKMAVDAWDFPIAGAALPQGLAFLPLCVGGALIAVFSLEQLWIGESRLGREAQSQSAVDSQPSSPST